MPVYTSMTRAEFQKRRQERAKKFHEVSAKIERDVLHQRKVDDWFKRNDALLREMRPRAGEGWGHFEERVLDEAKELRRSHPDRHGIYYKPGNSFDTNTRHWGMNVSRDLWDAYPPPKVIRCEDPTVAQLADAPGLYVAPRREESAVTFHSGDYTDLRDEYIAGHVKATGWAVFIGIIIAAGFVACNVA